MSTDRIQTLPRLPHRPDDGHKGVFGAVAIVGGSAGVHSDERFAPTMIGAPALAALGAVRAGCGLVKVAAPAPIIEHVLTLAPFATGFGLKVDHERSINASGAAVVIDELLDGCDVMALGMGMGPGHETAQIAVRLIAQEDKPLVVDADAINALCDAPDFARDLRASAVFTPHPGEAQRLLGALGIEGDPKGDEAARTDACARLAQRLGCVVVLKGRGSVVSDGRRVWVCGHGHPAMGVAGTGDVLAGAIASVIAQTRNAPGFDLLTAAAVAVEAHAIAGQRWAEHHNAAGGMDARELADELAGAIESLRG